MTEDHKIVSKRPYRKWMIRVSALGLGCCLIAAIIYYAVEIRPHYIEIDTGRWQWDYVKRSTVIDHEVGNGYETDDRIWMWQGSGRSFIGMNGSVDETIQRFDTLLREQGWYVVPRDQTLLSCELYTGAFRSLDDTNERLLVYRSHEDDDATACVYVRATLPYLEITLTTANPSPKTRWWSPCPFGC
jgi:hypothetical protein